MLSDWKFTNAEFAIPVMMKIRPALLEGRWMLTQPSLLSLFCPPCEWKHSSNTLMMDRENIIPTYIGLLLYYVDLPVNVCSDVLRSVIINDTFHAVDINASGSSICAYQPAMKKISIFHHYIRHIQCVMMVVDSYKSCWVRCSWTLWRHTYSGIFPCSKSFSVFCRSLGLSLEENSATSTPPNSFTSKYSLRAKKYSNKGFFFDLIHFRQKITAKHIFVISCLNFPSVHLALYT